MPEQQPKLTEEQKAWYLERHGIGCPFCMDGEAQIEGDHIDVDAGIVSQGITCLKCHNTWYDVYTLTHVSDPEP